MKPRIRESEINRLAKEIAHSKKHTIIVSDAGIGKSMIAMRVREFLPPLVEGQQEVYDIYKASGMIPDSGIQRPLRAPHHTVSLAALSGARPQPPVLLPRFGELSLAHRGVLILDEIPEFRKNCLEGVAYAMKHRHITYGMGHINWPNWNYPADFQLVATANTCPCGYFDQSEQCQCTESQIERYKKRFEMIKFEEVIKLTNHGIRVFC